MTKLFSFLFRWWLLHAEDPDGGGGGGDGDPDPDLGDPDPGADPDPDGGDPDPDPDGGGDDPPPAGRRDRRIDALLTRTQQLEAELASERRERERERRERAAPPRDADPDPPADADEITKWTHGANKTLKTVRSETQAAMLAAADARDVTVFESYMMRNPRFEKYRAEVDARLEKIRNSGGNAPRRDILAHYLGELHMKAAGTPQSEKARKQAQEKLDKARGKPAPSPRGNVATKEKKSEHEKRRDRLQNQIL